MEFLCLLSPVFPTAIIMQEIYRAFVKACLHRRHFRRHLLTGSHAIKIYTSIQNRIKSLSAKSNVVVLLLGIIFDRDMV